MKKKTEFQINIFLSREMRKLHFFILEENVRVRE